MIKQEDCVNPERELSEMDTTEEEIVLLIYCKTFSPDENS